MADTSGQLARRVLPEVPVRQWVLSLPSARRDRLSCDAPLVRDVVDVFVRCYFTSLWRRARKQWATATASNACAATGTCPAIATERLSRLEDGRLLYRLKHRWRDGTRYVVFMP
jgi:hypothetical protein